MQSNYLNNCPLLQAMVESGLPSYIIEARIQELRLSQPMYPPLSLNQKNEQQGKDVQKQSQIKKEEPRKQRKKEILKNSKQRKKKSSIEKEDVIRNQIQVLTKQRDQLSQKLQVQHLKNNSSQHSIAHLQARCQQMQKYADRIFAQRAALNQQLRLWKPLGQRLQKELVRQQMRGRQLQSLLKRQRQQRVYSQKQLEKQQSIFESVLSAKQAEQRIKAQQQVQNPALIKKIQELQRQKQTYMINVQGLEKALNSSQERVQFLQKEMKAVQEKKDMVARQEFNSLFKEKSQIQQKLKAQTQKRKILQEKIQILKKQTHQELKRRNQNKTVMSVIKSDEESMLSQSKYRSLFDKIKEKDGIINMLKQEMEGKSKEKINESLLKKVDQLSESVRIAKNEKAQMQMKLSQQVNQISDLKMQIIDLKSQLKLVESMKNGKTQKKRSLRIIDEEDQIRALQDQFQSQGNRNDSQKKLIAELNQRKSKNEQLQGQIQILQLQEARIRSQLANQIADSKKLIKKFQLLEQEFNKLVSINKEISEDNAKQRQRRSEKVRLGSPRVVINNYFIKVNTEVSRLKEFVYSEIAFLRAEWLSGLQNLSRKSRRHFENIALRSRQNRLENQFISSSLIQQLQDKHTRDKARVEDHYLNIINNKFKGMQQTIFQLQQRSVAQEHCNSLLLQQNALLNDKLVLFSKKTQKTSQSEAWLELKQQQQLLDEQLNAFFEKRG